MGSVVLTFATVFFLILIAGCALFYRQSALRRLSRVVAASADVNVLLDVPASSPSRRMARMIEPFQRVLPRSRDEVSVVRQRLNRAGYREETSMNVFYGAKVLVPGLLALLAMAGRGGFFLCLVALGLGFLLPDFWLGHRIRVRQTCLRLGLPDGLDLIVICVEAGLGMDRAVLRASEELRLSQPEIADELALVSLEQRAGRTRADAWKRLGERTGVESICAVASILIQSDRFGTSVGKALRSHAETLRTRRRQDAEEMAAKTTVKLIFPLALFIFPALFVVTLGPSMIVVVEQLRNLLN